MINKYNVNKQVYTFNNCLNLDTKALASGSKKVLVSYDGRLCVELSYCDCTQRTYIMYKIDSRGFVHSTQNKKHNFIPVVVWKFLDSPTLD